MAEQENTLFGAVLDVRYGSGLNARVEDLLRKLRQVKLTDSLDLGDVFAGICLMQHVLDQDGNLGRGASRAVIAAMVGLDTVFADGKILKTLGREAAVTIAGNRVYCRHPSIAAIVVKALEKEGSAQKVYERVAACSWLAPPTMRATETPTCCPESSVALRQFGWPRVQLSVLGARYWSQESRSFGR